MHQNMARIGIWFFVILGVPLTTFAAPSDKIETQRIESKVYDRHVNLGGTIIPYKKVTITAQLAGQIDYIAGVEGDVFKGGELLVSTNGDILLAQRSSAMAEWQRASYVYQNTLNQYNRELWSPKSEQTMLGMAAPGLMDQMFTRPFSNAMGYGNESVERQANIVNAQTAVQEAIAQMQQIKSKIDEIDVKLSDTQSVAPFDGVIVKKMVEAGDTVQPGQPLLVFAKNNHLSLEVNVPVNLMLGIQKGAIYKARLSNKTPIPVRVSQIFPVADDLQHTVKVKFDLPVGAPAAPGMYADVSIANASSQNQAFPTIPESAVLKRGSLPSVFTVAENGTVEMKIVRVGKATLNGYYIILSGVEVGQRIITNPPPSIISGWVLKDGQLQPPTPPEDQ